MQYLMGSIMKVTTGRKISTAGIRARVLIAVAACLATFAWSSASADVSPEDLPVLGDASSRLISPEMERQIGSQFLKQLHASLPTIDDPILKYWVNRQVTDLAQHSELHDNLMQVVLIDSKELNAFAAPGGVVGVNMGLLLDADDISEYSAVLAHELAHLSQRHFARGVEEQRSKTLPTIASLIAAIMIGAVGGGDAGIAAMSASQAAAQSSQLRFSRSVEQEADRIGINTLVRAGLDPRGMPRMFERMQRVYRFSAQPPEFLLTHPLTEARIADAREQVSKYPARSYPPSEDYQLMRVRAEVHYADSPDAALKQFKKEVEDHPNSSADRYGLALALSESGDHKKALVLGDELFSEDPQSILHTAIYAELLMKASKYDQADQLLTRNLTLNPDSAPLAMLYAHSLTKQQNYAKAESVLQRQSVLRKDDVDVWYQLAEVAGQAGDIVEVHRARAEYFALHGAYQKAIAHLEYARRIVDQGNRQLLAQLDQRIDDFRTAMRVAQS